MGPAPRPLLLVLAAFGLALGSATWAAAAEPAPALSRPQAERLFAVRVLPLFKAKCFSCHGDDRQKIRGEYDMRTRPGLLAGGESGEPAVVPGDPGASPLHDAVNWDGLEMPPKENDRLTDEQVEWLRQWIAAGAPWPGPKKRARLLAAGGPDERAAAGVEVATSGGLSADWTHRRYQPDDIWAYRPVRQVEVPWSALGAGAERHPIDAFLARKLRAADVEPAPPATRAALVRRATFDLTGLPPTPDEIDAFVADGRPDAYRRLLERLLASPHYGERMAQRWLDVVRYADSSGFANDYERPNAWRYRDYVVRSFQADKRFDRFIVEQLAGDELPASEAPAEGEGLIAVGLLRSGPWEQTAMSVAAVTRQQFLDDVTHSVGVTFLAQQMRCCKCHDHKFDPLPTRDYYRLQAVFAPVQFADRDVPYLSAENVEGLAAGKRRAERVLAESRGKLAELRQQAQAALQAALKKHGVKRLADLPAELQANARFLGLSADQKSLEKIYRKRIAYFERELKRYEPLAFSLYSGPPNGFTSTKPVQPLPPAGKRKGEVPETFILTGGAIESPAARVAPGVLSALRPADETLRDDRPPGGDGLLGGDGLPGGDGPRIPASPDGRRLALARWIASPENPLTARVIVNRIWQQHFGERGIVATPSDFGTMGARPTHPELLDWLARWFVEHDWSIGQLHRLIMTSAAYRRSAAHPDAEGVGQVDPRGELLASYPTRRLAAEELRDAMLQVTGELNRNVGGPPAYPEIHWEVALQPRHIMGSVAPAYQPSPTPAERNRRTLYAIRIRTLVDPLLEVFNRPGSDISCARRDETTITPQVFALFNGQFAHDRALALAARLSAAEADDAQRVQAAFRQVLGRAATAQETSAALAHVTRMTAHHRAHPPTPVEPPRTVKRRMIEELTGDPVEWEEPLDQMEAYEADLKPWDVTPRVRALAELCLVLLNSNEFVYVD